MLPPCFSSKKYCCFCFSGKLMSSPCTLRPLWCSQPRGSPQNSIVICVDDPGMPSRHSAWSLPLSQRCSRVFVGLHLFDHRLFSQYTPYPESWHHPQGCPPDSRDVCVCVIDNSTSSPSKTSIPIPGGSSHPPLSARPPLMLR